MDIGIFFYPFFIVYISAIIFTLIIPPIYIGRRKVLLALLFFAFLSILVAYYSYSFGWERRAILVATSAILWFFPITRFSENILYKRNMIRLGYDSSPILKSLAGYLKGMGWKRFCYRVDGSRYRFSTNFFETTIEAVDRYLTVSTKISDLAKTVNNFLSMVLVGYTAYIFYSKAFEKEIVSVATTLSVVAFLVVALIALQTNIYGFLERHQNRFTAIMLSEIRRIEKSIELAQAIKIAEKFKKVEESG